MEREVFNATEVEEDGSVSTLNTLSFCASVLSSWRCTRLVPANALRVVAGVLILSLAEEECSGSKASCELSEFFHMVHFFIKSIGHFAFYIVMMDI